MTQANVKFSVYDSDYGEEAKRNVINETPIAENLQGFFQAVAQTLESEITSGKEGDRLIRYRMLANGHPRLVEGTYILLTHKKHPVTRGWVEQNVKFQYEVRTITPVDEGEQEVNIALVHKDRTIESPQHSGRQLGKPLISGIMTLEGKADA